MISSLLLPRDLECPAITTATNATFSLQLIVESFSSGAKQVAPATILDDSFKLIDTLASEGARFAQILYHQPSDLDSSQLIVDLISINQSSKNIINSSFKLQKLIVIYSKRSLHFREDCGIFCEGEWRQHNDAKNNSDCGTVTYLPYRKNWRHSRQWPRRSQRCWPDQAH